MRADSGRGKDAKAMHTPPKADCFEPRAECQTGNGCPHHQDSLFIVDQFQPEAYDPPQSYANQDSRHGVFRFRRRGTAFAMQLMDRFQRR